MPCLSAYIRLHNLIELDSDLVLTSAGRVGGLEQCWAGGWEVRSCVC